MVASSQFITILPISSLSQVTVSPHSCGLSGKYSVDELQIVVI